MKVSSTEVAYVADLAHLDLTSEERERMLRDLNSILEYVDRLNQLDTSGVEPMAQVMPAAGADAQESGPAGAAGEPDLAYARRPDVLTPSLPHDAALANSPAGHPDFFQVPKVIER